MRWTLESDLWVPEFFDIQDILEMGAVKHGSHNWLSPNGGKSSFRSMHDSMFHHLASSFSGVRLDNESGKDHLLHLATRSLMTYTRIKRGLIHQED
jgi:hypothetical protein